MIRFPSCHEKVLSPVNTKTERGGRTVTGTELNQVDELRIENKRNWGYSTKLVNGRAGTTNYWYSRNLRKETFNQVQPTLFKFIMVFRFRKGIDKVRGSGW